MVEPGIIRQIVDDPWFLYFKLLPAIRRVSIHRVENIDRDSTILPGIFMEFPGFKSWNYQEFSLSESHLTQVEHISFVLLQVIIPDCFIA